jgi:hypothetical protein
MKIMPARTYEELCELKQSGKITWLQFVEMSEHADDFHEWCEDHGVEPDDNYAELFLEETETRMSLDQEDQDIYEKLQREEL